jgi:HEAT repeat protein
MLSLIPLSAFSSSPARNSVSIELLIDALDDPDADRRWHTIDALGASGDQRAVAPLIAALRKDMTERRGFAMAIIPALGRLKDESAVPLLLEALNNRADDWLAREAAAQALGEIGSAEAAPALIRAAWMADTRNAAIIALAKIGDPGSVDVLLSAFSEPEDPKVREAAAEGLVRIGKPAVPTLIQQLQTQHPEYPASHERVWAARVLGKTGDPRGVSALTKALDDSNEDVRNTAREALKLLTP